MIQTPSLEKGKRKKAQLEGDLELKSFPLVYFSFVLLLGVVLEHVTISCELSEHVKEKRQRKNQIRE